MSDSLRACAGTRKALWFSDIAGNRVYRYDPATDELAVVAELPSPSGLGFDGDRAYAVSLGYDLLYGIDLATGDAEVVLDLAAASGTFNFNDMISDGEGCLYAGSVGHRRDMTGGFAELDHSRSPAGTAVAHRHHASRRGAGAPGAGGRRPRHGPGGRPGSRTERDGAAPRRANARCRRAWRRKADRVRSLSGRSARESTLDHHRTHLRRPGRRCPGRAVDQCDALRSRPSPVGPADTSGSTPTAGRPRPSSCRFQPDGEP